MKGKMENCKYFNTCGAPLCPKDPTAKNCAWYPDEDICRLRYNKPEWVKIQKKIQDTGATFKDGYFTKGILEDMKYVREGIKGLDPDAKQAEMRVSSS